MRAAVSTEPGSGHVEMRDLSRPDPEEGQLLLKVKACGVCRTDLHVVDGELPDSRTPIVPGHEVVAIVAGIGDGVTGYSEGDRVGVPWLGWSCGECEFCRSDRENLCPEARFTGYELDGGYADYMVADARFCFVLPEGYGDAELAPLLCAGLIGHRAHRLAGDGKRLGLYGFGAAAHILAQVAVWQGKEVFAFTRPGDADSQEFALDLGCAWAKGSDTAPPVPLDAAILFAPVGDLVVEALSNVRPGGTVVCAGIHMSDIPSFPYRLLWEERVLRSVANLTREDAQEFLALAPRVPVRTRVTTYPLENADQALTDLREGKVIGAAVLVT